MQANDYLHDPLSHGDPMAAISSRGDLLARDPQLFGGIDTKAVAAYSAFGRVVAISGPTHETLRQHETPGPTETLGHGPHRSK